MKTLITFVCALLLCGTALATNKPAPLPSPNTSADSHAAATSASTSGANANSVDYYDGGRSYALMNAGRAAPMPATSCPMHDTAYTSLLWGLVTIDRSTARVDHLCLDKVLASVRPVPAPVVLPVLGPIHPTAAVLPSSNATAAQPLCTPLARKTKLGQGCPR